MNHPAEIAVYKYLEDVVNGRASMKTETIEYIVSNIREALQKQFTKKDKKKFTFRMSNVGKPSCQLWWEKNKPEKALPHSNTFIMNMMLGDIVEAVFKGLLTESGVKYEDSEKVTLDLPDKSVSGTYDIVIDDAVDDIKSASDWSYRNKFESYDSLYQKDGFGYVAQLAGYAKASGKRAGGWWVVNKANGEFKYVPSNIDVDSEVKKIEQTISAANSKELVRCFEPEPETFRGKLTGNYVLNDGCKFCSYRFECWPTLQELPAVMSKAKEPKPTQYVEVNVANAS